MCKSWSTWITLTLSVSLAAAPIPSQNPSTPTFHSATREVSFDMVVLDRHGRIVPDLRPEEIEVLDNGRPQVLRSCRLVTESVEIEAPPNSGSTSTLAASGGAASAVSSTAINVVTLLFDRLDPAARVEARRAALDFVQHQRGPRDYVSVWLMDLDLKPEQIFTTDVSRLTAAIERVTETTSGQTGTALAEEGRRANQQFQRAQTVSAAAAQTAAAVGRGGAGAVANAESQAQIEGTLAAVMDHAVEVDTEMATRQTMSHLLGVLSALGRLPGRKSVLYFTQRLGVDASTAALFRDVLANANRAQVSLYVLDPGGLDSTRQDADSFDALSQVTARSATQRENRPLDRRDFRLPESSESVPYKDRLNVLRNLAESTGGLLIANTNDLRPGIARISEDVHRHYALSYALPGVEDGSFHQITIHLKRPHLTVRARTGYYALPSVPEPVVNYELPLFALLQQTPPPDGLTIHQSTLMFPQSEGGNWVDVGLRLPLPAMAEVATSAAGTPGAARQFSIMALVSDSSGRIIHKFSQSFAVAPSPAGMAAPRNVLFERHTELSPGNYHLTGAALDIASGKAVVRKSVLRVPASGGGELRTSSLVVVERLDPLPPSLAETETRDPLVFGHYRVVPNVAQALHRGQDKALVLYFVTELPPAPAGTPPSVELVLSREGSVMGRTTQPLGAALKDGTVPTMLDVPLTDLTPGDYTAEIRVHAGGQIAIQYTAFEVQ
ncbi:MAG: VWA domain-containing protein [Terriglobales bacterium]